MADEDMQQQMQEPMEEDSVPGMGIQYSLNSLKNLQNDNPYKKLSSIAPNWRQTWDTTWPCPNYTLKTSTLKELVKLLLL